MVKIPISVKCEKNDVYYQMEKFRVLLVEDDPLISKALSMSLPYAGFSVILQENFKGGLQAVRQSSFDAILLDINLPDGDGYHLCQCIRAQHGDLPILMLTARTDEESAVNGIECGADDYIRKPCGVQEIAARMRRLIHKNERPILRFGSIRIDAGKFKAWSGDAELALGKREHLILSKLVGANGDVVSREEILAVTDQDASIYDRTIDSHLSHLRKKLKRVNAVEKIEPVYGVGYRLTL